MVNNELTASGQKKLIRPQLIAYFDGILHIGRRLAADTAEKIRTQQRGDSFLSFFLLAHHRKRLTRPRLSVGEDAYIVALV